MLTRMQAMRVMGTQNNLAMTRITERMHSPSKVRLTSALTLLMFIPTTSLPSRFTKRATYTPNSKS